MYLRYIENNDKYRYIENNNNKNNIFEFYARIICIHIQIYFVKIITKDNKRKKNQRFLHFLYFQQNYIGIRSIVYIILFMLEIFLFNSKFISTINDEIKENFNNQTKFKTFYVLNFLFDIFKKNNRKLLLNFYFDQKENKFKYSKYFFIS